MKKKIDYRWVADGQAAAELALSWLQEKAAEAIRLRGRFVLALAGGSTPKLLYQLLAETDQDWCRWYLIYGDERCLAKGHVDRNSTMIEQCWLNKVAFPPANHYLPAMELGADAAALDYAEAIAPLLPIDVALLGMGEDGHTASLFPGHTHPPQRVVPVHHAPKPPDDRISLSYQTLTQAASICLLVTGKGKEQTVMAWMQGVDFPIANIHGTKETVLITDIELAV